MSEQPIPADVETIPDPTEATFYVWVVQYPGSNQPSHIYPINIYPSDGGDPIAYARQYDPRRTKGNENAKAALVRVSVPLSELRYAR